ncbi:MAG TPA: triple tyrosine motif-containing protein [Ferruginibacter sp.]|nr:hypothetical protein [Chitinophagaceae bacterium]HRI24281.1 triple tyrosine motif-containing protein [Ferruginibacter sp.]
MKNYKNIIFCLLLQGILLFPTGHTSAQSAHPLTNYTTEQGLSLNSVNDLLFDRQGFLWITTADGLQRFDGYRFQTFRHDPADSKSIPENSTSEVFEDMNSNLWVTFRTGICFKPKGKIEFTDLSSLFPTRFSRFAKVCLSENDSAVWVAGYPDGIFSINKKSLDARKIAAFPAREANELVYAMVRYHKKGDVAWLRKGKEKNGDLLRIDAGGLHHLINKTKTVVYYLLPVHADSLVVISDKFFYIAAGKDPFTPVRVLGKIQGTESFNYEHLNQAKKIKNNQYLLPGIDKLFVYDGNNHTVSEYPYTEYFPKELARLISPVTSDNYQNDWIGFNGIGGIKVSSLQKFNLFNRPQKNLLPYTITGDQKGNIYTGIYLGDIEMYDSRGQFLKKFFLPAADKITGSPRSMQMIDTSTLIVRSTLNELYAIDIHSGKLQVLSSLLPSRSDSVIRDFETDMRQVNENEIWFTYSDNILALRKYKGKFSCSTVCKLPVQEIPTSFFYDHRGTMWIATPTSLWAFEKNKFRKIALPVTYIKHVNVQADGTVWLASTNGIMILKNDQVVKTISVKDGLPNSFVYSVLFDGQEDAWVSTNRGIAKIIPPAGEKNASYRIISYTAKEGLQGDEFNTKGYYKSSDGTLYFAGVNGINYFKPEELVNKSAASPTMLTHIEVNNLPYNPGLQAEFINSISLSHRDNNISLSFSCMDFTVPEKNQYKFWLKGFQDNWSLPQTNNTVQYILPPGDFQLYVLGANYEGVWSKVPLVLNIHILPPWYQTTLARVIGVILALLLVGGIFYLISRRRYLKKLRTLQLEQEVQKEKQRLSRDLHDNIGSQLTWLSNTITQLEQNVEQQHPVAPRISQLKEGTSEMMKTLRETIWIMNKEKISALEFFDKLISHAARYLEAYPGLELETSENIGRDYSFHSGKALQLFRICQEIITNACRHAHATVLSIKAETNNGRFLLTIADNGQGFDPAGSERTGHYGLQNMQERAEESNLELKMNSAPGKGTSFFISSPV